jgi:hypothetical protein
MKSRQYVRLESHRNQEKQSVEALSSCVQLLMSIVEDRRHVDVPSHSVKFDSSHGLMHPLMLTSSLERLNQGLIRVIALELLAAHEF